MNKQLTFKIFIIFYMIVTISIAAIGDALFDSNDKLIGHIFHAIEVLLLIIGGVIFKVSIKDLYKWVIIYTCFNIAGFDILYNWVRGIPILQAGSTSYWDKLVDMILPMGMVFIRILFLWLGIGLIFKFFNR